MCKGLVIRNSLDFSTGTPEVKNNAFEMLKKIYFRHRIYIHSRYESSKIQNIYILRHIRFQKVYLLCTVSGKATRESAPPKSESKPRKQKTWDAGHRRLITGKRPREFTRRW